MLYLRALLVGRQCTTGRTKEQGTPAVLHPHVATRVLQDVRGARAEVPNPFAELTDRELEVLRLVAEGLSNAQIAERLVLGQETVKGYVSNILSKLYLADRTQAAVFAWREGMMRSDHAGLVKLPPNSRPISSSTSKATPTGPRWNRRSRSSRAAHGWGMAQRPYPGVRGPTRGCPQPLRKHDGKPGMA
jgi:DNA-binding CsgD family transcriptional regulator